MASKFQYIIVFLMVAIFQSSVAQIIKEKKLTDASNVSMLQYSDDEYIYVGTEVNPDKYQYDVTLTKTHLDGSIIWKNSIDWNVGCTVKDAALLPDNSIIIAGSARISAYESYPFVMKTDSKGEMLWSKYYRTGIEADKIIGTSDGGYLFAYYLNGSRLMKLDASGDSIWSTKIGDGKPYGLAETSEAVYLLVDDEGNDIVLSSIGSGGEIIWKRTFGGDGVDQPVDVINAFNGDDYLFAGKTENDQTGVDFHIGLIDCFGYVNWTKSFGGTGTDLCFDLMQSADGHFIAVGISDSYNETGKFDYYAVKFDGYGNTIWTKTIPVKDDVDYSARNVFETSYGSLIIAGPKLSGSGPTNDSYLIEFVYPTQFDISFESDKQTLDAPPYTATFKNNTQYAEHFNFIWHFGDGETLASDENPITHEYKKAGVFDVKLVVHDNDFGFVDSLIYKNYINVTGVTTSAFDTESNKNSIVKIQPNPFHTSTTISFSNHSNTSHTLKLMDQNGSVVRTVNDIRGNSVELSRNNLPAGIYFIEISGETTSRTKLMIY